VGGWRGTLGTYDLNLRLRRFLWKSDETCLGEERSREVIDLTEPDVIRQCWEVYLLGHSVYVMGLIRFRDDKQLCWTGGPHVAW